MAGKRTYRTSQGKSVDLGALLLQHENTRAVGNMGVNARGDRIDNSGNVVDSKVQQTSRQYNKQVGPVDDLPVASRRAAADSIASPVADMPIAPTTKPVKTKTSKPTPTKAEKDAAKAAKKKVTTKKVAEPKEVSISVIDIDVDEPTPNEPAPVAPRGLADAIARARSIKQEQAKTPRQLAQEKAGVRKI